MNLKKYKNKKKEILSSLNSSINKIHQSNKDDTKLNSGEKIILPIISTMTGAAYRIERIK